MPVTKDEAKQKVTELVAKYESLSPSQIKAFNEANTKQSFIEPLFKAMGWDVDNTNEVTLEEKASNGRVDYAFKLNGVSQFYLEAKPMKADLTNPDYIKQAVTYAYNKGVTWVVLTDFEWLRLFNAQQNKPFITLKCQDYLSTFDKLWLLSHESLAEGFLNKEAAQSGALQSPLSVETRLFRQLRQWREDLFNQLHLYNKELSFIQIDEVIQRLFDRLIFIRTCEDRGIEEKRLLATLNQWKTGRRKGELVETIRQIFREFDGYYDSDLFARHLTDDTFIMGTTLEEIIDGLYEVPGGMTSYDFSIIDADVLGAVYEQYLGHVAQIVKQRAKEAQAKMDLGIQTESITLTAKKGRRKEQGIYYTPKFVTDYIVKETVGRFIKEHTSNEIQNIRILDPACGSGSFLIRAYDELLNYHANERSKRTTELDQWERLSILTGNIFGIDLDMQAVEIARLNLLLRSLARREILPSLKANVRQGNSLISGTEEDMKKHFGDNWREEKPFNWDEEFKEIMTQGGFDVVIGNPPYGIVFDTNIKDYLEGNYLTFRRNNDIFVAFIQRGIQLLRDQGIFAFILPNTFLGGPYFNEIRNYILDHAKALKLVDFGISRVFLEPNVFNAIVILQKEQDERKRKRNSVELTDGLAVILPSESHKTETRLQSKLPDLGWRSIDAIVSKSLDEHPKLRDIAFVKDVGFNYWTIGRGKTRGGSIADRILYDGSRQKQQDLPFIKGRDIDRYYCTFNSRWLKHNYQDFLVPEVDVFGYGSEFLLNGPKIIYRQTADRIIATIDSQNFLVDKTLHSIRMKDTFVNAFSLKYILGILNSKLSTYIYRDFAKEEGRLFAQVKIFVIKKLPIRRIDFNNPKDKNIHDNLVALVDKMIELTRQLASISDTHSNERDELEREIERTDNRIDNLVYDLYGLTETERKTVEGTSFQ